MKKSILIAVLACISVSVFSQNDTAKVLVNKKGTPILPAKGDYGLGIDALPYLEYLGNVFNNTANNTLNIASTTLYGKYFLSNNTALRAKFCVVDNANTAKFYVTDDAEFVKDPLTKAQTEDWHITKSNTYAADLAYQKYRGYGRLKGFYGLQAGYAYNRLKNDYQYGNPMTVANQKPTSKFAYGTDNSRQLSDEGNINQTISVGTLAGVEFYFAPKMCIGIEMNLSLNYTWFEQYYGTFERVNGTSVEEYNRLVSPGGHNVNISTFRPANYGGLYVMFHF